MDDTRQLKLSYFAKTGLLCLGFGSQEAQLWNLDQALTLQQCQKIILWLEECKIRFLSVPKRAPLRLIEPSDVNEWVTHFFKYLKALNVEVSNDFDFFNTQHRLDIMSHLITLAIQDEYMDAKEGYNLSVNSKVPDTQCLSLSRAEEAVCLTENQEAFTKLTRILTQLGLIKADQSLHDLSAENKKLLLQSMKTYEASEEATCSVNSLTHSHTELPALYSSEDERLKLACKILRSLHLQPLLQLQELGNSTVAQLQNIVADPKVFQQSS